jgi:hypothetical protein
MVSRWVGPSEVKLWIATRGASIPQAVGRGGGFVSVIDFGEKAKPAGIGRESVILIDFAVPERALELAGVGRRIRQPLADPIYNVSIHVPEALDLKWVLRHGGS